MIGRHQISRNFVLLVSALAFSPSALANPVFAPSDVITVDGRLIDAAGRVVEDAAVQFNIEIRSGGPEACLLWSEDFTANMLGSDGKFVLDLGKGTKASNDPSLGQLSKVFANDGVQLNSLSCAAGTSFTPGGGTERKVVVRFKPPGESVFQTFPGYTLNAVPYSLHARNAAQLGGKNAGDFLQLGPVGSQLTQANLNTTYTAANWTELQALLAGTSSKYATSSTVNGAKVFVGTPTTPAAGSIWLDGTTLKYHNGSGTQTISSGGTGTVTSVTAGTGLTGGAITGVGTIAVDFGSTAGKVAQGNDSRIVGALQTTGGAMTGALSLGGTNKITNLADPTANTDAATKQYVTAQISALANPKYDLLTNGVGAYMNYMPNNTACTNGQTLIWNNTNSRWECGAGGGGAFVPLAGGAMTGALTLPSAGLTVGASELTVASGGNVGIGTSSPMAKLDVTGGVRIGDDTSSCASGNAGTLRYSTSAISYCNGSTWNTLSTGGGTFLPLSGGTLTGSLTVNDGGASTSSSTGALVVSGGVGVSGNINSGGSVNATASLSSASVVSPLIQGGTAAIGSLTLASTSNATKGNILIGTSIGEKVGIGTTAPSSPFHVSGTLTDVTSGFPPPSGSRFTTIHAPASNSTATVVGVAVETNLSSTNNSVALIGTVSGVKKDGSGGLSSAVAGYFNVEANAGSVSTATGVKVDLNATGGTVTTGYGVHIGNVAGTSAWGVYQELEPNLRNLMAAKTTVFGPIPSGAPYPARVVISNSSTVPDQLQLRDSTYNNDDARIQISAVDSIGTQRWSFGDNSITSDDLVLKNAVASASIKIETSSGEGLKILGSNGNVGIGTDTPAERLHVVGNIAAQGNIMVGESIVLSRSGASSIVSAVTCSSSVACLNVTSLTSLVSVTATTGQLPFGCIPPGQDGQVMYLSVMNSTGTPVPALSFNGSCNAGTHRKIAPTNIAIPSAAVSATVRFQLIFNSSQNQWEVFSVN